LLPCRGRSLSSGSPAARPGGRFTVACSFFEPSLLQPHKNAALRGGVFVCGGSGELRQPRLRVVSNRNQARRSAWSIQTSIRLAVATSFSSSQSACASRRCTTVARLSSASSASMPSGVT